MPSPEDIATARERRAAVVAYITDHTARHGYPPNRAELAERFAVAPGTVDRDLHWLRKHDEVTWVPNRPRTLRATSLNR